MTATTLQWAASNEDPFESLRPTDPATDHWIVRGTRSVSRERLLEVARSRLANLLSTEPPDDNAVGRQAAATLNAALDAVIDDEQPTPQVFAAGDGAVTCEWLVGGTHVMITAEADGTVYWSSDPVDGMAAAELECLATDVAAEEMAQEFRQRLNLLAQLVSRRHPVVGSAR